MEKVFESCYVTSSKINLFDIETKRFSCENLIAHSAKNDKLTLKRTYFVKMIIPSFFREKVDFLEFYQKILRAFSKLFHHMKNIS